MLELFELFLGIKVKFVFESYFQLIFQGLVETVDVLAVDVYCLFIIIEHFCLFYIKKRPFKSTVNHNNHRFNCYKLWEKLLIDVTDWIFDILSFLNLLKEQLKILVIMYLLLKIKTFLTFIAVFFMLRLHLIMHIIILP